MSLSYETRRPIVSDNFLVYLLYSVGYSIGLIGVIVAIAVAMPCVIQLAA